MATPHVAGVAALWAQKLQQEQAMKVDVLKGALVERSEKTGLSFAEAGRGMVFAPQE
jgi:hypothetical protein